jgi:hypothetical protein
MKAEPEPQMKSLLFRPQSRTVRVIYVVPSDAEPWAEARRRSAELLEDIQRFFADEMERLGYKRKTFDIAQDRNGDLAFNQIPSLLPQKMFNKYPDYRNNCINEARDHGLPKAGDIVVYFHESCSIIDGEFTGKGAKSTRGNAFLGSLHLKLAIREWIDDDTEYTGKIIPWISAEPLKPRMLSWNGRGRKLGDISGAAFGIIAHELGHCFGLEDEKDDWKNCDVNLMRKGCRRMRGYFRPDLTPDRCFLSQRSAAVLDANDLFSIRNLNPSSIHGR